MLDAARNLEFEKAAQLRDQLKQIRVQLFGVVEQDRIDADSQEGQQQAETKLNGRGQRKAGASSGGHKAGQ